MKKYSKFILLATTAFLTYATYITDPPRGITLLSGLQLIDDAHAVMGVRRRTRRRSVAVGYSMGAASAQQQTAAQAPAPAPAPAPVQSAGSLAIGSIVTTLPTGCVTSPKDGVQYYDCGGDFYRTAFQGNNLVYVVAQP